jgi:hypothetical protein
MHFGNSCQSRKRKGVSILSISSNNSRAGLRYFIPEAALANYHGGILSHSAVSVLSNYRLRFPVVFGQVTIQTKLILFIEQIFRALQYFQISSQL